MEKDITNELEKYQKLRENISELETEKEFLRTEIIQKFLIQCGKFASIKTLMLNFDMMDYKSVCHFQLETDEIKNLCGKMASQFGVCQIKDIPYTFTFSFSCDSFHAQFISKSSFLKFCDLFKIKLNNEDLKCLDSIKSRH